MCGIAGVWHRDGEPVDPARLLAMTDTLEHRGRDDQGTWIHGGIGFGHRRLSIIDLSPAGHQPMHAPDHGLSLVFNGEIHNYLELRDELVSLGHAFHTGTDTEVVLIAYAQWGMECFERFNGMWAIALWNERRQELLLARDRFGIKPLMYAQEGARVMFASEAKALLSYNPGLRQANWEQVHSYLVASVTDIGATTFFKDIHALLPGHCLLVTRGNVREIKTWKFEPGPEIPRADAKEAFRHLLDDAVRLRMRSDAPLGVWLSGGLDSSVIAALAAKYSARPVKCFSLRYDKYPRFDESEYVSAVVENNDHLEVEWIRPDSIGLIDTIRDIVRCHDAPTVARGRCANWATAKATARDVRVALSGDGADELLGGYQTFGAPYALDRVFRPPPGATRSWRSILQEYTAVRWVAHPGLNRRALMLSGLLGRLGVLRDPLHSVFTKDFAGEYGPANPHHVYSSWASWCGHKPFKSLVNNALWREFLWRGLPEMMKGFDAVSMAHTLEIRSPFLDHRVVEFCFSLPYYEKIRDGVTKRLLRDSCADLLPEKVRTRRHKLGFPSPLFYWFGHPENRRQAGALLRDGQAVRCGIFDPRLLDRALTQMESCEKISRTPRHILLWHWISLEWWLRMNRITS